MVGLVQQLQEVEHRVQRIVGVTHMLPFRSMVHYRHEARADYLGRSWARIGRAGVLSK